MKYIVTHLSPDLDAVTACWLIKRFLPGWKQALIKFIPAGQTLNHQPPDDLSNIIHVDTGLGRFDHHQTSDLNLSATKLVFLYLKKNHYLNHKIETPLERLVDLVTFIDHFQEVFLPQPEADIYDLGLHQIIEGLKNYQDDNQLIITVFPLLDAVFLILKNKIRAEEEIKNGLVLKIKWGKALILETKNEEAVKLALKMGYSLVIRQDPEKKYLRIKTPPKKNYNLTLLYQELKKKDPQASWFLHISNHMLLNGSSKNPHLKPTKLSLSEVIKIIKKILA
ncbi:MAG: chromate resistance protein [Patescibacteria group bacterium]|nr:chromate resistance protein [Patescibacteria group bacterium]